MKCDININDECYPLAKAGTYSTAMRATNMPSMHGAAMRPGRLDELLGGFIWFSVFWV